jgi:hypothetical protein
MGLDVTFVCHHPALLLRNLVRAGEESRQPIDHRPPRDPDHHRDLVLLEAIDVIQPGHHTNFGLGACSIRRRARSRSSIRTAAAHEAG